MQTCQQAQDSDASLDDLSTILQKVTTFTLYHNPLGAQNERAQLAHVVQLGRIVRDGAAVCDRVRTRRHEYHPVRLLLTIGTLGQLRALGWYPRIAAVAEHRVLPQCRAGAVGEGEALVIVVDVGIVRGAC